jgi:hypothetical protein
LAAVPILASETRFWSRRERFSQNAAILQESLTEHDIAAEVKLGIEVGRGFIPGIRHRGIDAAFRP